MSATSRIEAKNSTSKPPMNGVSARSSVAPEPLIGASAKPRKSRPVPLRRSGLTKAMRCSSPHFHCAGSAPCRACSSARTTGATRLIRSGSVSFRGVRMSSNHGESGVFTSSSKRSCHAYQMPSQARASLSPISST